MRRFELVAEEFEVDVGVSGPRMTWGYNRQVPGPELRVRQGERIQVIVNNRLPQPTTIHWHGLPVPNAMDGVPGITQAAIPPGDTFVYEFDADTPGTYFYHSHVGLQLDRGLYGPLVIESAEPEPGGPTDGELVLVLDDWLDGSPEDAFADLRTGGAPGPGGMGRGPMAAGEILYAGYLVNGTTSAAANPIRVSRGQRLRLRLINAAASTTFRVAVPGHRLLVTHADGQPIEPVPVDSLVLGMGERCDVVLEAVNPGVWPLLAGPVDSVVPGVVVPVVYAGETAPLRPVTVWPSDILRGRTLSYADLAAWRPDDRVPIGSARVFSLVLGWVMGRGYVWTINGQAYPNAQALVVGMGERVRFEMINASPMRHPMHLHGHFFRVLGGGGPAPSKDTVTVAPMMGRVDIEWVADNPGRWFFHCHHLYHMEAGMARVVELR